ncbi:unnamed protein product [Anisakis simplex]|uniref:ANK_REP_REGION domain-containing protein n=1 Tax=Anisakis simplex TaxID=6269 RepID=A0A0M3JKT0_ANISI|nr:unnamed protein product [Anisakis simplex]
MQYTRAKPTLPDLWLAVRRGNARAVNVLIEHNVLQENGADELNLDEHKKRVKELMRSSLEIDGDNRRRRGRILIDEMVKVFVDRDDDFVVCF